MTMPMKKINKTLISVFIISVIGALVFSFAANFFYYSIIRNINSKETIAKISQTNEIAFSNIERSLKSAKDIATLCLTKSKDLFNAADAGQANSIRDNIEFISKIASTSPIISAVDIYYPDKNLILTNSKNMHFAVDDNGASHFLPWLDNYKGAKTDDYFIAEGFNAYPDDEKKTITYVTRTHIYPDLDEVILAMHISPDYFRFFINEEEGDFAILEGGKFIYASGGKTKIPDDLAMRQNTGEIQTLKEAHTITSLQHSAAFTLTYAYILPLEAIPSLPYFSTFILSSLFLIGLNILIVVLVALNNDRIYKAKVKRVFGIENAGRRKENFDDSITKLEEKYRFLNSSYQSSQPVIIQSTLRLLLLARSSLTSSEQIERLFPFPSIIVAIGRFANPGTRADFAASLAKAQNTDYLCYFTSIKNDKILIMNAPEERMEQALKETIDLASFKIYLSSCKKADTDSFPKAFEEASIALSYRYLYPDQEILRYEELGISDRLNSGRIDKAILEIENQLLLENRKEVELALPRLLSSLTETPYTLEYCKTIIGDLLAIFSKCLVRKNLDSLGLFGYDIRDYFLTIPSLKEFGIWIDVCFGNYFDYLEERKEKTATSEKKERIDQALRDCATKDLSLDAISGMLRMRSDELSKDFKLYYGTNFSEYVRSMKTAKAKLLLAKGYRVNEVSEELGYSSVQYFIKVFKNETGYTPLNYAKKIEGMK